MPRALVPGAGQPEAHVVCADGGNPDPTSTRGKDPLRAKKLELQGWPYPKHFAGRAFAIVAHGDAAGPQATLDTWIGWYRPYATSHEDLDADQDVFVQVQQAALSLANMVQQLRSGAYRAPNAGLHSPREK
jgi:hypothetical protein